LKHFAVEIDIDRAAADHAPLDIPWKRWKDIVGRTVNQASQDRLFAIAAYGKCGLPRIRSRYCHYH
jgi:hypothetical protein